MSSTPLPSVALRDGRRATLGPLRPDDRDRFAAFLADLDDESRRRRFHQVVPEVHPWFVRPLVEVDQTNHVAWLASIDDRVVGEARYVRSTNDPTSAEIAYAVAGDVRGTGLGRRLVETLAVVAGADGLRSFSAVVGADNRPSAALLTSLGVRLSFQDGWLEGTGPIPPWTAEPGIPISIRSALEAARAPTMEVAA